jgi:ribosome recycling factor
MPVEDICLEAMERMEKAVEALQQTMRTLRTGRATPALVDHIRVDYYGSQTPLRQIANIATPEAELILIRPYDPSVVKDICKAIQASEVGIMPQTDGKIIRMVVPPLSEERRRKLATQVRELGEEAKIAIRNVRRDANKHIDSEEKEKLASEDEAANAKEEVQKATKDCEGKVDDLVKAKTAEIMTF